MSRTVWALREAEVRYTKTYQVAPPEWNGNIISSATVARLLREKVDCAIDEYFYVIALNARNEPIAFSEVAHGHPTGVHVNIAQVFRLPILLGAVAIVIAHNHPSQTPKPSAVDVDITRKIGDAGRLLGIPLVDHVIVCEREHYSFLDAGMLGALSERS